MERAATPATSWSETSALASSGQATSQETQSSSSNRHVISWSWWCAPTKGHPLVASYRDRKQLQKAIPHANRLIGLPKSPFVGEFSYRDISRLLDRQSRWFTRPERRVIDQLRAYLEYKLGGRGAGSHRRHPTQGHG